MNSTSTKGIVASAFRSRVNRVYYEKCFTSTNLHENGLLQVEEKSHFDRVVLDESKNEFLRFYGFGDRKGSHFDLSLSILSLCPSSSQESEVSLVKEGKEFRYRLANLDFTYVDLEEKCKYTYKTKQLLDYSEKRRTSSQHDSRNVYKIGSLSIEVVLPFSLMRIVFNGYLNRSSLDGDLSPSDDSERVSVKLTISTHPSADKFDYKYRFEPDYVTKTIKNARNDKTPETSRRLLNLMLDDRIDLPLMYQFHLERTNEIDGKPVSPPNGSRVMYGAKVRRFIDANETIRVPLEKSVPMDDLFLWCKVGHLIHLSRPSNCKRLVTGMIHSAIDYASSLSECKLTTSNSDFNSAQDEQQQVDMDFNELDSFVNLKVGMQLYLKSTTGKEYNIKITGKSSSRQDLFVCDVNGYEAWALCRSHNAVRALNEAQSALWTLNIHDRKFGFKLASESLLGGKGNSLVVMNKLLDINSSVQTTYADAKVSIPRGVVVSCVAYELWLKSNPLIEKSIQELDNVRRTLAARSVYTNPLSDDHMPLAQSQQILREQCKKTCLLLNSCPLPQVLVRHLRQQLLEIFTEEELNNKPAEGDEPLIEYDGSKRYKCFAVRSSAVGEDSLETSAAGQMRTILDARGFDSIIRSIVDCWSSQFEPEAVMYKTQNGLEFNLPMAVVVQELVASKAAGVATTCDPLTGDKSSLQILANLGLGEGVVSGGKTDTIRVSLKSLKWNELTEEHEGQLLHNSANFYQVVSDDGADSCCLASEQIAALANLMLWLRRNSEIKDREAEWAITTSFITREDASSSSSSSSSASESPSANANQAAEQFQIHLLQSRPLTHLLRLNSREIDHELDYGMASPINLVSRANLGEVMPGALCPLTSSYFMPICTNNMKGEKPFEPQHTYKPFAAGSFSFHAQLASMVLTYTDTMTRFGQSEDTLKDNEHQDRIAMFRAMIGTTEPEGVDESIEARIKLTKERINPQSKVKPTNLFNLFALDTCGYSVFHHRARKLLQNCKLQSGLSAQSIGAYIEQLESRSSGNPKKNVAATETLLNKNRTTTTDSRPVLDLVEKDIRKLWKNLTKDAELLASAWKCHITATLLNMAMNAICMKVMAKQDSYPDSMAATEILNDFSTLMQGGHEKTESGNISSLLNDLIGALSEEGKLEQARQMKAKELYSFLAGSKEGSKSASANSKAVKLFNEFIKKNGHRSFKEFDFSTLTWEDDPSYIIKSFTTRLKLFDAEKMEQERAQLEKLARDRDEKIKEILEQKVQSGRALLTGYLLPRCRHGTVRREGSKSILIEAISKYRQAFRYLGGLLCLAGRLPSADLIHQLTIEEVDVFVNFNAGSSRADLSRLLYKCRRRQQRQRVMNQFNYPRPLLDFNQMVELTKRFTGEMATLTAEQEAIQASATEGGPQVTGITSCAGCVTGRACVVQSLEDMDQIQPNDILVTYSIDISWSVYFFTLSGIVTEIGGIVSHGAVVAREYGIPTLCTAVGACSVFKTGQMITLDANRGICYLATSADAAPVNGATSST